MVKRKVISESGEASTKKLKAEVSSEKSHGSQLSYDSPRQCFQSVIYPKTIDEFFEKSWEKEPLLIQRNNTKYYGKIYTKAELEKLVKKEQLEYDIDLFISRYNSKQDERVILEAEGKATLRNIQKYFNDEKATVMLSRPHRFNKDLHNMLQLLEQFFGSCAYAHLEITPADSQGHAPCYIGKEVFILQLEGKKRWRLYKSPNQLAIQDSEDLDESEIGEVVYEYIIEAGDLLYLPRGTVFQAASLVGQHSTDISIEMYDENSWGNFLSTIVAKAVTRAVESDISFREGLPLNYLSYMGGEKALGSSDETPPGSNKGKAVVPKHNESHLEKQKSFGEKIKKMLVSLAQYLDPHWGADFRGTWFMGNRLAPLMEIVKPSDENTPDDESLVQLTFPGHVRIVFIEPGDGLMDNQDDEDDEEDEDEEDEDDEVENEDENASEEISEEEEKESKKDKNKKPKGTKAGQESEKKSNKTSVKSTKKEAEKSKDDEDEGMEEGGSEDPDSCFDGKPCVIVQHSLQNDSDDNIEMVPGVVQFPVHYGDALLILHRSTKPVAVKDLPLSGEERVKLAVTLWAEGLLKVKDS